MMTFPGPDRGYTFKITLKLVEEVEQKHGSLYRIAEEVLNKNQPFSATVNLLKTIYRQAGFDGDDAVLEEFLFRQPCVEMLTSFLLEILRPAEKLGAISPGEARTA